MTCALWYQSEYIEGCNIYKFGEGCERCIPIFSFENPWLLPLLLIGVCGLILFLLTKYIEQKK